MAESCARLFCVLKYMWERTDEDHPVSITDIQTHLDLCGLPTHRRTIPGDLDRLQNMGIDVVCVKSNKNLYFIGERVFELPEVKLLIDAVQSCRFITAKKSAALTDKLAGFSSAHQADSLQRQLFVENRVKTDNKEVYFAIDILNDAINGKRKVRFQYYQYLPSKKKALKHDGRLYEFSPYALVWNNDAYYAIGHSESHGKVVKFRVDRMCRTKASGMPAAPKPDDFDASVYVRKVFQMYDEQLQSVSMLCNNELMNPVIDHFGESVKTKTADAEHFIVTVEVSVSPTFFAWIFTFAGKMQILSPAPMRKRYFDMLSLALKDHNK